MIDDVRPRRRDVEETTLPGSRDPFNLLALNCDDIQRAHFETVKVFQNAGQPMDGMSGEEFLREKEVQEVYLMCLSPDCEDPKERLFKSAKELRQKLDLTEVGWIQNAHTDFKIDLVRERGLVAKLEKDNEADEEEEDAGGS